jgi:hypothetical protein
MECLRLKFQDSYTRCRRRHWEKHFR